MKLKNIKTDFTMVPNQWFKARLSLKAIGLITLLQSLPDNWEFTVAGIETLTQDGKGSIQSALWELENIGFIKRNQTKSDGRWSHTEIVLQIGGFSDDGNSVGGFSADGKTATINNINNKEKKNKESKSVGTAKAAPTCAPEAYELAKLLHHKIVENKPNRKIHKKWEENWSVDIDKIHRLDKREWADIRKVIEWCQDDSFWWKNILSGETLRTQFDRLEDDMKDRSNEVEIIEIS